MPETLEKKRMRMSNSEVSREDIRLGALVRFMRLQLGLSQAELGRRIGVTFQQIQKYEKGSNAMSPRRLREMSCVFQVPMSAFFPPELDHPEGQDQTIRGEVLTNKDIAVLLKAFHSMSDQQLRKVLDFLLSILSNRN